ARSRPPRVPLAAPHDGGAPTLGDHRRRAVVVEQQRNARRRGWIGSVDGIARQGMTTLESDVGPLAAEENLHTLEAAQAAADVVRARFGARPDAAIILGTGLGRLAAEIDAAETIEYSELPGFPLST